jgi:hypothetical protein
VTVDDGIDLLVQVAGALGMLGISIQYVGYVGRSVERLWLRRLAQIVPLALLVSPLIYGAVTSDMWLARFELIMFGVFTALWTALVLAFCSFFVVVEQVTGNLLFYKGRYWSKRYGTPMPTDEPLDPMPRRFVRYVWTGLKSWPEFLTSG